MDPKTPSATDRIYEDFDPIFEWASDETSATLRIMLPGFSREHLKIQVTSDQVTVSGERRVPGNKWRRFNKQLGVPFGVDTNKVNAKVEGGLLYVKFPRVAPKLQEETTKPPSEETPPQKEKEPIREPVETPSRMVPTTDDHHDEDHNKEAQQGRVKKVNKFMNLIVIILLVVILGLSAKNAFRSLSSPGGLKFQEL